jgi:hypothetical protein
MANSVLRYLVEITQPIVVVENLLLIAMLTLFTSPTKANFPMVEVPSMDKNKSMRPMKLT